MKKHSNHPHKHARPHHHYFGLGKELVKIEDLVQNLQSLFLSYTDMEWATREATAEAPPHKQVRNAIILGQLAQILQKLNPNGLTIPTIPVMGRSIRDYEFQYPIGMPKEVHVMVEPNNHDEVMEWIGEGPPHEIAMDLTLMNGLAAIKQILEKHVINPKNLNDHENHPE